MDRDAPLTEVERWSIFQRIEEVLAEVGFGRQVHRLCRPAYSQRADGRPGIDPVVYFKMGGLWITPGRSRGTPEPAITTWLIRHFTIRVFDSSFKSMPVGMMKISCRAIGIATIPRSRRKNSISGREMPMGRKRLTLSLNRLGARHVSLLVSRVRPTIGESLPFF